MKYIVAMDSFKGCLSSFDAGKAVADGIRSKYPDATIDIVPMTDGGDGMLDVFSCAMGATKIEVDVYGPLMQRVKAAYAVADDNTAIIEVAQACGLALMPPEGRNPLVATSYGVGQLVAHAVKQGCRNFIIGLGGSGTCDAGMGMLKAIVDILASSGNIDEVVAGIMRDCRFTLASDVDNPLLGCSGAARVFGPQKGADPDMVEVLERRASRFACYSARHFGLDHSCEPGAGAAGGIGYAFMQYFDAEAVSGADYYIEHSGFDSRLSDADIVVTGEGSADAQTLMGKLPQKVMEHASRFGVDTILLAGRVSGCDMLLGSGFSCVAAATPQSMTNDQALRPDVARRNLSRAVAGLL